MKDIRLKETPFELDGKTYLLRCNMNVLADVQEFFDGSLDEALSGKHVLKNSLVWLSAMLNDYSASQGWPERFTPEDLGRRKLIPGIATMVMELAYDGLTIDAEKNGGEKN